VIKGKAPVPQGSGGEAMTKSGARRPSQKFSRPLAEFVNRALDPLVAKQGFGESSVLLQWETIVGARIAGLCQPIRLRWPPRAKSRAPDKPEEPATLSLRVEPGFGLDIQHMSGAIINRVNAHLGWRCIGKIVLVQEPLRRDAPKPTHLAPRDPAARDRAEEATLGIEDEALRKALVKLGERAMTKFNDCP
jgi:hypothetical protein